MPTVIAYLPTHRSSATLTLWIYSNGTLVNAGGDALAETPASSGRFAATVAEALSGDYHAEIRDGATDVVAFGQLNSTLLEVGAEPAPTAVAIADAVNGADPTTYAGGSVGNTHATNAALLTHFYNNGIAPKDGSIKDTSYDQSTAFPIAAVDAGGTQIARGTKSTSELSTEIAAATGGSSTPRLNKKFAPRAIVKAPRRLDRSMQCTPELVISDVDDFAFAIDMSPLTGEEFVKEVAIDAITPADELAATALGPRDELACIQLGGGQVESQSYRMNVTVTMDNLETWQVYVILPCRPKPSV